MHAVFTFLLFLSFSGILKDQSYRVDFGSNSDGDAGWYIVNDGVMGGRSIGKGEIKEQSILFEGVISLENNGGFASIRSQYGRLDLSNYEHLVIRYRSSGEPCKIMLESSSQFWQPYFAQRLEATDQKWRTARFNLKEFKQYRLTELTGATANQDDLKNIIRVGIMTDSKKASAFSIEIDYILYE